MYTRNGTYNVKFQRWTNLFLRERNRRAFPSFTNAAARALKVRWESVVFLIPADVFTRAVWQLIGIYGILL